MTETTGATCPTCTTALPAAGAPCPRCAGSSGFAVAPGLPAAPASPTVAPQYAAPQVMPYQPDPYQQAPYQPGYYPQAPYQPGYPPAPYQGMAYPPASYPANPYAARPQKSAGVAILLTLLWIGAGHLYLDRVGTGLSLMAAHFFVGFILFIAFAPLGFLVWLAAAIGASVWCSNLAGQINAGTVPPRQTW